MTSVSTELAAARAAAAARVVDLRAELDDILDSASSTTGDDEHDPEGATIGFERAQAQAMLDRAVARVAQYDLALANANEGAYGWCRRCGRRIGTERLEALPGTDRCVDCARVRR